LDGPITIAGGKTNANHIADFGIGMLGSTALRKKRYHYGRSDRGGARLPHSGPPSPRKWSRL